MEGVLAWDGKYTIPYTDDVLLWNCTPEAYIILLTSVTPINSLNKVKIKMQIEEIDCVQTTV